MCTYTTNLVYEMGAVRRKGFQAISGPWESCYYSVRYPKKSDRFRRRKVEILVRARGKAKVRAKVPEDSRVRWVRRCAASLDVLRHLARAPPQRLFLLFLLLLEEWTFVFSLKSEPFSSPFGPFCSPLRMHVFFFSFRSTSTRRIQKLAPSREQTKFPANLKNHRRYSTPIFLGF